VSIVRVVLWRADYGSLIFQPLCCMIFWTAGMLKANRTCRQLLESQYSQRIFSGLKDCGYFTLTKNGKKVSVVIHHVRYLLNLEDAKVVLDGKRNYALVLEFVESAKP
jgi:hypothetical protein